MEEVISVIPRTEHYLASSPPSDIIISGIPAFQHFAEECNLIRKFRYKGQFLVSEKEYMADIMILTGVLAPFSLRDKLGLRQRPATPTKGSSAETSAGTNHLRVLSLLRLRSSSPADRETSGSSQKPPERSSAANSYATKQHAKSYHGTEKDPLGLSVIYSPDITAKVDIIFIHGLGGTSQTTWSKNKDLELFWPQKFLPLEPDICQARIMTFGYNANFLQTNSSSVLEFAKGLLYDMKFAHDDSVDDLHIGQVPLIFVAHSMGGLIVKEAYLQGQLDPEYQQIIKAVTGILFMATPHRGSNFAAILNRILQVSIVSSPKDYVSDLVRNSFMIQKINDQFRHIAPKLNIVSFYETQPTPLPLNLNKIMVVERDSSILGYPGELSRALDANHHTICKYEGPKDPRYVIVRNYLKVQVAKLFLLSSLKESTRSMTIIESQELERVFGVTEPVDTDYLLFRDRWAPGTCGWILKNRIFCDWVHGQDKAGRLLWLTGSPGSGKSVLSSFLVNHLAEENRTCQYIFLRFEDQNKKSLNKMLRSLAVQISQDFPEFRHALSEMSTKLGLSSADPRAIWERVFKAILFKLDFREPLFWIIDGLDECDSPGKGIKLLSEVLDAPVPIRLLLTSRPTTEIEGEIRRLSPDKNYTLLTIGDRHDDYHTFIKQQLDSPDPDGELCRRLVETAQGSFLWIKLTIDRINRSYTDDAVERAFQELSHGMEQLYDRMADCFTEQSRSEQSISSNILAWVTCSFRLLTVSELLESLEPIISRIVNFQKAITDLCGGFVVVANSEMVTMVHQTAREYLIKPRDGFFIDERTAHQKLFLRCLDCLNTVGLRNKISNFTTSTFLDYAISSWGYHFENSDQESQLLVASLVNFLRSSNILTWVHAIAKSQQLHILLQTSIYLSSFVARRKEQMNVSTSSCSQLDLEFIEGWAIDLGKLVGKFGGQLLHTPDSIYKMIPPFCPANSMLHKQFVGRNNRYLRVTGFLPDWDDSLARLSFTRDFEATALVAEGDWIAIVSSSSINKSTVFLYSSTTYQEVRQINYGEKIRRISLNSLGTLLVTCGLLTTKIWDLRTGNCVTSAPNPVGRPRPQTLMFRQNDEALLIGTDDRRVWSLSLLSPNSCFEELFRVVETAATGGIANSPGCMSLSPDGQVLALGYRRRPLSLWDLESQELIRYCPDLGSVTQMIWHPYSGQLYGLMLHVGSQIFKWSANDEVPLALYMETSTITMSSDGNLLATGDHYGNVKLLSTADMSLLYQVVSQDPVIGLAFSTNNTQLYDIRPTYGNIWEPNILLKLSEPAAQLVEEASRSDYVSYFQSKALEGITVSIDPITALGSQKSGRLYCSGTRRGTIRLFDISRGLICELNRSPNFFSIQKIAWSSDEHYVCYADVSRTIFIDSVGYNPASGTAAIERVLKLPIKYLRDNIDDVVFQPESLLVLVCTVSAIALVSIELQAVIATQEVGKVSGKWVSHPGNDREILFINSHSVTVLAWSNLEKIGTIPLDFDKWKYFRIHSAADKHKLLDSHDNVPSSPATDILLTVDTLVLSPSKQSILLKFSTVDCHYYIRLLDISHLDTVAFQDSSNPQDEVNTQELIKDIELPPSLTNRLNRPLSFLGGTHGTGHTDVLLFLDCDSWVCTWSLSRSRDGLKSTSVDQSLAPGLGPSHKGKQAAAHDDMQLPTLHYCLPGDWSRMFQGLRVKSH
ncbi:NACHT and WD domain-containing protein [Phlyctema vagabunda]|uniref:NACHT and WD domain-containing protein n=1 Tax=Phlyctema vagabunda TaxID=108571 RepID=A0ABR4PD11_9HELO